MKEFRISLTDEDGTLIRQFKVGAYRQEEAEDLFEIGGARESEIDEFDLFVEVDSDDNGEDIDGGAIAREIRQFITDQEK